METENPYQPPKSDILENIAPNKKPKRPVYDTRWQATRAGMWNGALFGTKFAAAFTGFLLGIFLLFMLFRGIPRDMVVFFWKTVIFRIVPRSLAMIFACGTILGILTGLIEMIRFRKPK